MPALHSLGDEGFDVSTSWFCFLIPLLFNSADLIIIFLLFS
jgi:hypothetical protein